eukprot:3819082-Pleurochrysis_carterae.AAC.1
MGHVGGAVAWGDDIGAWSRYRTVRMRCGVRRFTDERIGNRLGWGTRQTRKRAVAQTPNATFRFGTSAARRADVLEWWEKGGGDVQAESTAHLRNLAHIRRV